MDRQEFENVLKKYEDKRAEKFGDVVRFDSETIEKWWVANSKISKSKNGLLTKDDYKKADKILETILRSNAQKEIQEEQQQL